jgi:membrane associated rhomboid family serine protease
MPRSGDVAAAGPVVMTIIAVCVIAFLAGGNLGLTGQNGGSSLFARGELFGPLVSDGGEPWRLVTYGFLHSGIFHIGFNMYLLYILGSQLEHEIGSVRFGLLYLAGLLGGAAGAMLAQPHAPTVGASGAVFALMGFVFVTMRARGFNPMASGIGPLIAINLVFSFVWPNVSWGGHVGGLAVGVLAALAMLGVERVRGTRWVQTAALAAVVLVALGTALFAASASVTA